MTTEQDAARAQLSEMTEITGITIDRTFRRHPDLDALYRDCPSAFWLAPDGDDALPMPAPAPVMPLPVALTVEEQPIDVPTVDGMSSGVLRATFAAGPIFAATAWMLTRAEQDQHWWDPLGRAMVSLIALPLTMTVGAFLAALPVLAGVLALASAGKIFDGLRRPAAWAVTGGLMGIVIAAIFDTGGAVGLALVATSIACAAIAGTPIAWCEPDMA